MDNVPVERPGVKPPVLMHRGRAMHRDEVLWSAIDAIRSIVLTDEPDMGLIFKIANVSLLRTNTCQHCGHVGTLDKPVVETTAGHPHDLSRQRLVIVCQDNPRCWGRWDAQHLAKKVEELE